jgi:hypothetical protein
MMGMYQLRLEGTVLFAWHITRDLPNVRAGIAGLYRKSGTV